MNESVILELLVNGGEGKSKAMEAIAMARKGNFDEAEALLKKSNECIKKAHEIHMSCLRQESESKVFELSILMIHAQDHLTSAITVRDLAEEFILMYKMQKGV